MNSSDDTSDDDDDLIQLAGGSKPITKTNRIDKILDAFVSTPKSSSGRENAIVDLSPNELRQIRETLEDGLRHRSQTCLICIETLKRNEAIWSCTACYTV